MVVHFIALRAGLFLMCSFFFLFIFERGGIEMLEIPSRLLVLQFACAGLQQSKVSVQKAKTIHNDFNILKKKQ